MARLEGDGRVASLVEYFVLFLRFLRVLFLVLYIRSNKDIMELRVGGFISDAEKACLYMRYVYPCSIFHVAFCSRSQTSTLRFVIAIRLPRSVLHSLSQIPTGFVRLLCGRVRTRDRRSSEVEQFDPDL